MFDGVRYILKIYEKYDDVPTSLTLVSLGIKLRQKQYPKAVVWLGDNTFGIGSEGDGSVI